MENERQKTLDELDKECEEARRNGMSKWPEVYENIQLCLDRALKWNFCSPPICEIENYYVSLHGLRKMAPHGDAEYEIFYKAAENLIAQIEEMKKKNRFAWYGQLIYATYCSFGLDFRQRGKIGFSHF